MRAFPQIIGYYERLKILIIPRPLMHVFINSRVYKFMPLYRSFFMQSALFGKNVVLKVSVSYFCYQRLNYFKP